MNKKALLKLFEAQIEGDIAVLLQSALAARDAATHPESKAEDTYDTRGLEASYLAGAQSKRAMELASTLNLYRHIDVLAFTKESLIAATAVVELESDEKLFYFLLMPQGGGRACQFDNKNIQVVTPPSPMGIALLGRKVGDEIEVEIQQKRRDYLISTVW